VSRAILTHPRIDPPGPIPRDWGMWNMLRKPLACMAVALFACGMAPQAWAQTFPEVVAATDCRPADPNAFEYYLTAIETNVQIGNDTVKAMVYKDDPPASCAQSGAPIGIPSPQIKVSVGDTVIVHFKNNLPDKSSNPVTSTCLDHRKNCASIHWHGIEVDNDSDGTAVTQPAVPPGGGQDYSYKVSRPGIFWYHSHMTPTQQELAGMYGPIVVEDANELTLRGSGVVPAEAQTHTLVLSDIRYDAAGNPGVVRPGTTSPVLNVNEYTPRCSSYGAGACDVIGDTILVNGQAPDDTSGSEEPTLAVIPGQRVRLRLVNAAISRYFRLKVVDNGTDNNLYRIGGEGGLLENVRLEGGVDAATGWDPGYQRGEVVLAPADRADVIILVNPAASAGDVIKIVNKNLPDTRLYGAQNYQFNFGQACPTDCPIAFLKVGSGQGMNESINPNDPVLASLGLPDGGIESIKEGMPNPLIDPAGLGAPGGLDLPGMSSNIISFQGGTVIGGPEPGDGVDGSFLETNDGVGTPDVRHPGSARYARVGNTLELHVRNITPVNHPFHMHGFSFQPVRYYDSDPSNSIPDGTTVHTFNYDEFIDNVDIYGRTTLVIRVRLDDRGIICDKANCVDQDFGGAVGRWVFHCHIFHHAAMGMMSELIVLPSVERGLLPLSIVPQVE